MNIKVTSDDILKFQGQVIAFNIFEEESSISEPAAKLDLVLGGIISNLINQKEIKGKFKEITSIFT